MIVDKKAMNLGPLLYLTQFIVIMINSSVYEGKLIMLVAIVYDGNDDSINYSSYIIRARAVRILLYVCHGGTLKVTCGTSADTLRWNVASPRYPTVLILEEGLQCMAQLRWLHQYQQI